MQQLAQLWSGMTKRQRISIVAATAVMFFAVLALARMASAPSMALLFGGLKNGSAAGVVDALERRGVSYEVRGDSIFVDAARRDELRMIMAGEGLPANSTKGYELLDGLSGFGTTSQMFDAAYWRAKEGELARTIVANPEVTSARVHIATTGSNPFRRDVKPSASVSLVTAGNAIKTRHARALRFLVASAVPGLTTENVAIIDAKGDLVDTGDGARPDTADSRADELRESVRRMLEARVGPGNVVVEVSLDTETSTERIQEKRIDPESRVAISTDTEERSDSASDKGGGGVTVASNLPEGEAATGEASSSETSETRERVNYEVSETRREITRGPGEIERMTIAVLVNGTMTTNDAGVETFQPRSPEEIETLEQLVASAVGFDESRGDVITIKTLQFQPAEPIGTVSSPSFLDRTAIDAMSLLQAVVLGIVAVILGLFVIRPILTRAPAEQVAPRLASPATDSPAGTDGEPTGNAENAALTGEIQQGNGRKDISMIGGSGESGNPDGGALTPAPNDQQVQRLRDLIGERQDETVEILRSWLEGEEEKA
ncbi:MAG: flagellar basal-body MS-ring/collar protein FliF [Roseovarius sp.]|nr:flagellar basal-body MS-ring/collar protein FliF [Roseovarius sp.]